MPGRYLGSPRTDQLAEVVVFPYLSTLVTNKLFIAPNPCIITDIRGVTVTAGTGGACTLQIFKASDGVAIASGTLLHSGSFNLVGTINVQQILTLVTTPGVLNLNVGDAVGFVLTGTATSAVGMIQITTEPV